MEDVIAQNPLPPTTAGAHLLYVDTVVCCTYFEGRRRISDTWTVANWLRWLVMWLVMWLSCGGAKRSVRRAALYNYPPPPTYYIVT